MVMHWCDGGDKVTMVSYHSHSLYVLDGVQHQEKVVHRISSRHEIVDDCLCRAAVGLVSDAFKGPNVKWCVHDALREERVGG